MAPKIHAAEFLQVFVQVQGIRANMPEVGIWVLKSVAVTHGHPVTPFLDSGRTVRDMALGLKQEADGYIVANGIKD